MLHCSVDDTKIQINYTFGNGQSETKIIDGISPINIILDNLGKKLLRSNGNAPIVYIAPGAIQNITCTGTFRQIGDRPETQLPCTYIIDRGIITGNKWESNYDSFYSDNTGDMTFDINYLADTCFIKVRDLQGKLIFKDSGQCPITYKVECIKDKCPEGFMKCKRDAYPGYCCIPCNEIKNEIASITAILRGING